MGIKIVNPESGDEPEEAPLDAGKVEVWFNEADWQWLQGVIGDARKQRPPERIKEATIIRAAIYHLSQEGGWSIADVREAVLRRHRLEPKRGRKPGSKAAS